MIYCILVIAIRRLKEKQSLCTVADCLPDCRGQGGLPGYAINRLSPVIPAMTTFRAGTKKKKKIKSKSRISR